MTSLQNAEIARQIERYADLLEIEGENPFRVRAYRNAGFTIRALALPLSELVATGTDLSELHKIGEVIAKKVIEIVETGHLRALDRLEAREGPELADLLHVPGLGPKRVRMIHQRLGVRTPQELLEAARAGRVSALPGLGPKTEQAIVRALTKDDGAERSGPPARGPLDD